MQRRPQIYTLGVKGWVISEGHVQKTKPTFLAKT